MSEIPNEIIMMIKKNAKNESQYPEMQEEEIKERLKGFESLLSDIDSSQDPSDLIPEIIRDSAEVSEGDLNLQLCIIENELTQYRRIKILKSNPRVSI